MYKYYLVIIGLWFISLYFDLDILFQNVCFCSNSPLGLKQIAIHRSTNLSISSNHPPQQ